MWKSLILLTFFTIFARPISLLAMPLLILALSIAALDPGTKRAVAFDAFPAASPTEVNEKDFMMQVQTRKKH